MSCHGLEDRKGNLDLRTVRLIVKGGEHGPAIIRGSSGQSLMFRRIAERAMPPEGELPLTGQAITMIKEWLDGGAATSENPDPTPDTIVISSDNRDHWAFRNLKRPTLPTAVQRSLLQAPIDHFVLAELEARSLTYANKASHRTLIRRVFFDLLGIPPSPEEVASFEEDAIRNPDSAFRDLVSRLLASPHFGERWGRHWLDAGGYVDTIGDDTDQAIAKVAKGKWRYRDYVINSLNSNKPFDQFITEQIAGDELFDWRRVDSFSDHQVELLTATTFLRSAADETLQNELNTADMRHEVLQRTMEVTINNLLGVTIKCARCHTHKYDPISHDDYYRLLACFAPSFDPQAWLQPGDRELPDIAPKSKAAADSHNSEIDGQIAEFNKRIGQVENPVRAKLSDTKYATLPESIRENVKSAIRTNVKDRDANQKDLAEKHASVVAVSAAEVTEALDENDRVFVAGIRADIATANADRQTWGTIQAVYDTGSPTATYLLGRGDFSNPVYEVPPGVFRVLDNAGSDSYFRPADLPWTSGRRLALANWMTNRDSPAAGLMARVIVNRVWQQLFGRGIVESSDNFGSMGSDPTHPELLDWLAAEFIETDWNYKSLIRLILSSGVYQQDSKGNPQGGHRNDPESDSHPASPDPQTIDPANELLWKMPLRQLESEAVRDSILTVAGKLDRTIGGPPVMTTPRVDGFVVIQSDEPNAQGRRSMYLLQRRRYHESLLESFGQPEVTTNCTHRSPTAVVSQALTLMNDQFLFEHSTYVSNRVTAEVGDKDARLHIERAFELAFCRLPTAEESSWSAEFLERQRQRYRKESATAPTADQEALRHLCHMLFCANEFLYIH